MRGGNYQMQQAPPSSGEITAVSARLMSLIKEQNLKPFKISRYHELETLITPEQYITALSKPKEGGIMYDPSARAFKILPYYAIANRDDLRNLILKHPDGLEVDEKLTNCYYGVLDDIISLRDEGWCREIYPKKVSWGTQKAEAEVIAQRGGAGAAQAVGAKIYNTYYQNMLIIGCIGMCKVKEDKAASKDPFKEARVLFPIDKTDTQVEVRQDYPANSLRLIRQVWNQEIPSSTKFNWENTLEDNNLLTTSFQKEGTPLGSNELSLHYYIHIQSLVLPNVPNILQSPKSTQTGPSLIGSSHIMSRRPLSIPGASTARELLLRSQLMKRILKNDEDNDKKRKKNRSQNQANAHLKDRFNFLLQHVNK